VSARRDLLIILGLFVALVVFIAFGPGRQPPPSPSAPTTHSSEENGAQALYEWIGRMGYQTNRLEYREFALTDQDQALVILSPTEPISAEQATTTLAWVAQGGTLILADETSTFLGGSNELLKALKVTSIPYTETLTIEHAETLQPALDQPEVGTVNINAKRVLVPNRNDYTALLGTTNAPLLIGIRHGLGYAYVSASSYPFSNSGLRDQQSARLVLNLLRRVPPGGQILFDEIHHGYIRPPSPTSTAFGTPLGWAGTYASLAIAAYLILTGRRFGRAVPLREESVRRSSTEYVESMADMLERGGKYGYIQRHYYTEFKRRLAKEAGIHPDLDDPTFVRELARFREIDQAKFVNLLNQLRNTNNANSKIIPLIEEADSILRTNAT
jgi:hypothetical protein